MTAIPDEAVEAAAHAVCPILRRKPCHECPDSVMTSEGEGTQYCRLKDEEIARAAISAALPMLVRAEWQPIGTAPKTGKVIGVRCGCAYWNAEQEAWYTITGMSWPGRRIEWEVTEWIDLDAPATAIRARGER